MHCTNCERHAQKISDFTQRDNCQTPIPRQGRMKFAALYTANAFLATDLFVIRTTKVTVTS
jgi:hypothetical protein